MIFISVAFSTCNRFYRISWTYFVTKVVNSLRSFIIQCYWAFRPNTALLCHYLTDDESELKPKNLTYAFVYLESLQVLSWIQLWLHLKDGLVALTEFVVLWSCTSREPQTVDLLRLFSLIEKLSLFKASDDEKVVCFLVSALQGNRK